MDGNVQFCSPFRGPVPRHFFQANAQELVYAIQQIFHKYLCYIAEPKTANTSPTENK